MELRAVALYPSNCGKIRMRRVGSTKFKQVSLEVSIMEIQMILQMKHTRTKNNNLINFVI